MEKIYDIVIIARPSAKGRSYFDMESALVHLGKLHHIYEKETQQILQNGED